MTTMNFGDALAELVRQFPAASSDDKGTALRKFSDLSVVSDQIAPKKRLKLAKMTGSKIFQSQRCVQ